jgi:hypothetical protein
MRETFPRARYLAGAESAGWHTEGKENGRNTEGTENGRLGHQVILVRCSTVTRLPSQR